MRVWKFDLEITDEQLVAMPGGAELLSVADQPGSETIQLWALVDPDAKRVHRRVWILGTGNPVPDDFDGDFIGTVLTFDGQLVWHVFDGGRP